MTAKTNLTINPQRLWDALMETATFGGTPKGGIKRLTGLQMEDILHAQGEQRRG